MKVHILNTDQRFLDLIFQGKKTVELRCGIKYRTIVPGDVIKFRRSKKDNPTCSCTVEWVEKYKSFWHRKEIALENKGHNIWPLTTGTGIETYPEVESILRKFYHAKLQTDPFVVIHLGEVDPICCPGDDAVEQV